MRVMFATAEYAPVARVGGLAAASTGLVRALRAGGTEVDVVLPDYGGHPLDVEQLVELDVPAWAGPAVARRGMLTGVGPVTLVDANGLRRGHPYLNPDGTGFGDNDVRFFSFSAAVAALVRRRRPDVLHLNDWHTAVTPAYLATPRPPMVLTIHTLGYQGWSNPGWLIGFPYDGSAYEHEGACNPLAGGIRLADRIVTVSPTFAREALTVDGGFGVDGLLAARGGAFSGILNGIDVSEWDPAHDSRLPHAYSASSAPSVIDAAKAAARAELRAEFGLDPTSADPLAVVVTRLAAQKGIDLLLAALRFAATLPIQFAVLGSGEQHCADDLRSAATALPGRVAFHDGYDEGLAHLMFAAGDLFVMPSRFEPCGLAQMQAMRYGTIPVVTDVGGLHDTVVDADAHPTTGTGIVAGELSELGLLDALHRAARVARDAPRRDAVRARGMSADWSWDVPAREYLALYAQITAGHAAED